MAQDVDVPRGLEPSLELGLLHQGPKLLRRVGLRPPSPARTSEAMRRVGSSTG